MRTICRFGPGRVLPFVTTDLLSGRPVRSKPADSQRTRRFRAEKLDSDHGSLWPAVAGSSKQSSSRPATSLGNHRRRSCAARNHRRSRCIPSRRSSLRQSLHRPAKKQSPSPSGRPVGPTSVPDSAFARAITLDQVNSLRTRPVVRRLRARTAIALPSGDQRGVAPYAKRVRPRPSRRAIQHSARELSNPSL